MNIIKKLNIIGLSICSIFMIGCGTETSSKDKGETYTIENPIQMNTEVLDMSGYAQLDDYDPAFLAISVKESFRIFDEGGTGIIYYGRDTCDYCNLAVPELNKAAKKLGVKIYYVNVDNITEQSEIDGIKKRLDSILDEETDENGNKKKVMYTPEVVAVKDGKIVSHVGTLEGIKINKNKQLETTDEKKLQKEYEILIKKIVVKQ